VHTWGASARQDLLQAGFARPDPHGDPLESSPFLRFFPLPLDLLYLSTSFLWWQTVVEIIGVKSSHALRSNSRCTWRHSEDSRNVYNTAIRRALSSLHPCGSVTADVHG
jgi:hypothetical protein